jgi:hypothetical protein
MGQGAEWNSRTFSQVGIMGIVQGENPGGQKSPAQIPDWGLFRAISLNAIPGSLKKRR